MTEPEEKHTWSQAFENVGCGLLMALTVVAVLLICTWNHR